MSKFDDLLRYGKQMVAYGPDGATYFSEEEVRELGKDFVLVPREPTEEMMERAMEALCGSIGGYEAGKVLRAWEAMIQASESE